VLLLRVNYLTIVHAFNDPDNGAVNCFKASEKTNEQWSDDGLKFTPSGYVLTVAVAKEKIVELSGFLTSSLSKMRV
jgi:hypothetical protein